MTSGDNPSILHGFKVSEVSKEKDLFENLIEESITELFAEVKTLIARRQQLLLEVVGLLAGRELKQRELRSRDLLPEKPVIEKQKMSSQYTSAVPISPTQGRKKAIVVTGKLSIVWSSNLSM